MTYTEMKDMTAVDLRKKRTSLSDDLLKARMRNSIGQLANPLEIKQLRRSIAKINTALTLKMKGQ
ncbi:MAG: 50S ribosomal protein L29 [Bdellovibrionota bacterium]